MSVSYEQGFTPVPSNANVDAVGSVTVCVSNRVHSPIGATHALIGSGIAIWNDAVAHATSSWNLSLNTCVLEFSSVSALVVVSYLSTEIISFRYCIQSD